MVKFISFFMSPCLFTSIPLPYISLPQFLSLYLSPLFHGFSIPHPISLYLYSIVFLFLSPISLYLYSIVFLFLSPISLYLYSMVPLFLSSISHYLYSMVSLFLSPIYLSLYLFSLYFMAFSIPFMLYLLYT